VLSTAHQRDRPFRPPAVNLVYPTMNPGADAVGEAFRRGALRCLLKSQPSLRQGRLQPGAAC
jgi:hypothetical protein